MAEILIIEDERDIVETVEYNLKKEGYRVAKAYDGISGLKMAESKIPSLILLDLMLPGLSGLDICRQLKKNERTAGIPIIITTAKGGESDRIVGLELGADDYMVKPFSINELMARVKAVLRRYEKKPAVSSVALKLKGLEIDTERHEVKANGKSVELTAKEFQLLFYLASNPGHVYSREQLLDTVWGIEVAIETRTVDVHMRRLRSKLELPYSDMLKTVRNVGYMFSSD